jgi:GT2 family glycosyltransferase
MMRIAVAIATAGRPQIVVHALKHIAAQSRPADCIVVIGSEQADLPASLGEDPTIISLIGTRGLTYQRNAGLDLLENEADVIIFFDDDFLPGPYWLADAERMLLANPDVKAFTGHVVADGIHGPGFSLSEAEAWLTSDAPSASDLNAMDENYPSYGCNMGFRTSAMAGLRFDERLKLYAWQEDVDFSCAIAKGGRRVRCHALRGVHMGVKLGRTSGRKLGYAQIVNPLYLMRKGTMTAKHALPLMARNILANIAKSLRPEPYVDRRGRLVGNLRALLDVCKGRIEPERAAKV